MNIQRANFEDLLSAYYYGTDAHKAVEYIGSLMQSSKHMQLATLLRDHRIRPIYSIREIEMRAATDRLMNCCSIMEIASLAGFIPPFKTSEFATTVQPILQDKHVRRYYEEFYPTILPKLLRYRLEGKNCETKASSHTNATFRVFLGIDRVFMEKLDDGILLHMLDSFTIQGYRFDDVVDIIGDPQEFTRRLLLPPDQRDIPSMALAELSLFMEFCFDLHRLLKSAKTERLLQSALWRHYAYWFDIIGEKLGQHLGDALSQFLHWKPQGGSENGVKAIREYVDEARFVLKDLCSQLFAGPIDDLAGRMSEK